MARLVNASASTIMLMGLLLLVPAGRVSELSIAGRNPDLFYVDILMLAAFLGSGLIVFQIPRLWRTGWRPLLLFLGVVLVGGLVSADRLAYAASLRPVLWAMVLVILAARLRIERDARLVLFALVLGVSVVAVEVLFKVGLHGLSSAVEKVDVELDWGRSNYFATFAVVSMFVSYGLMRSAGGGIQRAMAFVGLAAAVILLILSKSRAAMLAAVTVAVLVAPVIGRDPGTLRGRFSLAGRWLLWIAMAFGSLYLAYPHAISVMGYELDTLVDSGNLRRLDAWLSAIDAFISSPVWGIGWFNSTVMIETLNETATTTHSLPLQLLAETGVIGTAAVAVLVWRALKRAGPRPYLALDRRLRNGLRLAVIASLLQCMVEPSFWGTQFVVVFWVVLTLLHHSREAIPSPRCTPLGARHSRPILESGDAAIT